MLEHAIYSVISPEGAASILWRDAGKAQEAATNLKITAQDLLRFGVIDEIIKEPVGGAHRDPAAVIAATGDAIAARIRRPAQSRPRRHSRAAAAEVPGNRPQARLIRTPGIRQDVSVLAALERVLQQSHSASGSCRFVAFLGRCHIRSSSSLSNIYVAFTIAERDFAKARIGLRLQPLKDNDCSTASGQVAHNPDGPGCPVGVVVSWGAWA